MTESDLETVLERLRRYVEHESPSGDAAANRALAALIAGDLERTGAAVQRIDAPSRGAHLLATLPGREAGLPHLLVLGHFDTVHPLGSLARMPFAIRDGRIEGPGAFDMKAGIAVLLEALLRMAAAGRRPRRLLTLLLSCDEEIGSATSRNIIESAARGAAAALVLEPSLPGGAAKTARKGVAIYTIRARGRAAHAGLDPQHGVSAIVELAHQTLRIAALAAPELGTTINVGLVRGGTVSNVVAAEAELELDVRYATSREGVRVDAALRALEATIPGAAIEVQGSESRPPLERTAPVIALYEAARRQAARQGWELGEGSAGGASDGSLVAALGVPTLDGLGPDGGGAHALDEHVRLDDLPRRIALLEDLLDTL
ncbi:MAG: M20/M25/M40 family metallo-hydrolase [Longimicrobiales bacterium]